MSYDWDPGGRYRARDQRRAERQEAKRERRLQKGQDNLQMRVHLKLDKAFFPVDEYSTLRDFFAYVVKKENEQIVFKKTH